MTQQDLAERLGLSQPRIAEIERQPGRISVDQLLTLMHVLGATPCVARGRIVETGGDTNVRGTPGATVTARTRNKAPEGEW
jgi:HTH-type transcriptional regulator / antitoxin HipB